MHLTTILIGYFKLPVFTVHVSAWISPNFSVAKVLGGSPHSLYVHFFVHNVHHNSNSLNFLRNLRVKWDNSNAYLLLTFDFFFN